MATWEDMPKWHIIGTIHSATGFDALIKAPTEEKARASAYVMANNQAGADFQELCINSVTPVPKLDAPPGLGPTTISDETADVLRRLLCAALEQGVWVTCHGGIEVGSDPDVIPAGYYNTMYPPEGYNDAGYTGCDYVHGDLIPVYWDDDAASPPVKRLIEAERMLRAVLRQRKAQETP